MRTHIALTMLMFTLVLGLPRAHARLADPFIGKWKVTITPDEDARKSEREMKDTLVFQGDKFWSEAFTKRGFERATYEEDTRRMGPAKFTVSASSDKEGTMKWLGIVDAGSISGEIVWTKKDGTEAHFTFKGDRQP